MAGFHVRQTVDDLDASNGCPRILAFQRAFFDGAFEHAIDKFECILSRTGFRIGQPHAYAACRGHLRYPTPHGAGAYDADQ
jgi:hypothetical protein